MATFTCRHLTAKDGYACFHFAFIPQTNPFLLAAFCPSPPDFFNAKVKINGTLWVDNIVVTDKASNWYVKGMDKKKAYDNVVLVVAGVADTEILTSQGQQVAVMQMEVPQGVMERYKVLVSDEGQELCHQKASENCSSLMIRLGRVPCRQSGWNGKRTK